MVSRVPQPPSGLMRNPNAMAVPAPAASALAGLNRQQSVKQEDQPTQPRPSGPSIKQEVEESDQSVDSVTLTPEPGPVAQPSSNTGAFTAAISGHPAIASSAPTVAPGSDEARKIKRRQYQQKRRQSGKDLAAQQQSHQQQLLVAAGLASSVPSSQSMMGHMLMGQSQQSVSASSSGATTPTGVYPSAAMSGSKKRSRKGSKYDEDYDSFIESTMTQIRTALPPLTVQEPQLGRGCVLTSAGNIFGAGDLSPGKKDRPPHGLLKGSYGSASLTGVSDYFNTKPLGDAAPIVPTTPAPPAVQPSVGGAGSQRGFYHQEFGWPTRWEQNHHHHSLEAASRSSSSCSMLLDREQCDTPDTVVSSSSPECVLPEPVQRFPALRFIDIDEGSSGQQDGTARTSSPDIPILAPVPIRPSAVTKLHPDGIENQQMGAQQTSRAIQNGQQQQQPLQDATNVTVTLTLNTSAAADVTQVLVRLAALLRVPPPASFQIVEGTSGAGAQGGAPPSGAPTPRADAATPPNSYSQRLGLYRYKNKDGKEGALVDIQSILNGTAKFCRHCDVVILSPNKITKKAQHFKSVADNLSGEDEDEDYHFCSSTCFVQFAVATNTAPDRSAESKEANAVVDHLSNSGSRRAAPVGTGAVNMAASAAAASVVAAARLSSKPFQQQMQVMDASSTSTTDRTPTFTPFVPKWKGQRYRHWTGGFPASARKMQGGQLHKKMTENELTEMLYRAGICIRPPPDKVQDKRQCLFCLGEGDGVSDGPARLLNYDVDRWVHLNCALWHEEVFEMVNGALMNVDVALKQSLTQICLHCERPGASVKCFKVRCSSVYHLGCAIKEDCVFLKNKSVYCSQHAPKTDKEDQLTTLSVFRRVYINRDENRQVAAVMHHAVESNFLLRVGSLTFLSVGQLLPHQLAAFHSPNCIYPIGYQIVRFYWSPRQANKRCRYVCSIEECEGRPQFCVTVEEPERNLPDLSFKDWACQGVWQQILGAIEELRRQEGLVRLFPQFLNGEDLFGLNEPAIVRVLESLPGIESLSDYNFKYGRNPLLELPLAINPTGSARSEPKLRTHFKRFHARRTVGDRPSHNSSLSSSSGGGGGSSSSLSSLVLVDLPGPYSKQFVHSKSSQYKKMKQEWRHNVFLARSKIQGLGLYAARDIEKHTMVIEYIGELIRAELAEAREKRYDAANRGIYMFRLDEQRVIDATLTGGLARYINHSCNPNCVAEAVEVERDLRIIIFASRRITRGEEVNLLPHLMLVIWPVC